MSAFKIGGPLFRPTESVSKSKKPEAKASAEKTAPAKSGFDTVKLNKMAVMPRMSAMAGQSAQQIRSGSVEAMLKDSAAELDDYFAGAYGFKD